MSIVLSIINYVGHFCKLANTDAVARTNAFYGQGSGPINVDDPACTGNESRLLDCAFSPIHNCAHSEDAGVDCTPNSNLA